MVQCSRGRLNSLSFAIAILRSRLIVFSKTLSRVEWNNSTLVKEIAPEEITKMKHEPGRDIVIYGSASIVRTLTNLGLIDTYQLLVYPVVLGSGKLLFQEIRQPVKLSPVSTKRHPSGVVVLSYQPI
jgi:dihydrofolate reductase